MSSPEEPEVVEQEPQDGPPVGSTEWLAQVAHSKIEQGMQDTGAVVPPGHPNDPEPLDPVPAELRTPTEEDGVVEAPEEEPVAPPPLEEPDEETEEEAVAQDEEAEDFFLDVGTSKYKNRDEAARGLREKDLTIERLNREIAEQRQAVEDRLRQLEEADAAPQQIDVAAWNEWAEVTVQNGAGPQGAMQALQTGGMDGYNLYLRHWLDDDDQRADAMAFNNQVMLELADQRARAAIAPTVARERAEDSRVEAQIARNQLKERYPDIENYQEEMDRLIESDEIDERTKLWLAETARQGLDGKRVAWEYLYLQAARTAEPRKRKAAEVEGKRRRASGDAAKVAATVSTNEGSPSRTPLPAAEAVALSRKNALRKEWGLPLIPED